MDLEYARHISRSGMETAAFVAESNKIEGILRDPTMEEIKEHDRFISLRVIKLGDLKKFVKICQPGAVLRDKFGMNVRVGNYTPPAGNPNMGKLVSKLLSTAGLKTPFELHNEYETLHPFTDGNGRSGRALWAWRMMRTEGNYSLGFLHSFYYQALEAWRK